METNNHIYTPCPLLKSKEYNIDTYFDYGNITFPLNNLKRFIVDKFENVWRIGACYESCIIYFDRFSRKPHAFRKAQQLSEILQIKYKVY